MKIKNAMQLKALIKNKASSINVPAQLIMQNYVLERLLERITKSQYKESFIIKGGFLLSAVIGLDTRTTKDLDATIKDFALSKDSLNSKFADIVSIDLEDGLQFELVDIREIRENDEYPGLRVSLIAKFEQLAVPLSVDVTTGDSIIPPPILRTFNRMFGNGTFTALSYPLETVIAEKIETVLSRSTANTRARDYYDIYILDHLDDDAIDRALLREALISTALHRNSTHIFEGYHDVVTLIASDTELNRLWGSYAKKNYFAAGITFQDTCSSIVNLLSEAGYSGL